MRYRDVLAWIAVLAIVATESRGDTFRVPADEPTIQAGINSTSPGDTVLLSDGVYSGPGNYNIDFGGRSIVVMSEQGPDSCVIDCSDSVWVHRRGFIFQSGEDSTSQLVGVSIINGTGLDVEYSDRVGGAILCRFNSAPRIRQCHFENNITEAVGGALFVDGAAPIVEECNFVDNNAFSQGGGVFYMFSPRAVIRACSFESNAANNGGAVAFHGDSIQLSDCQFVANRGEGASALLMSSTFPSRLSSIADATSQAARLTALIEESSSDLNPLQASQTSDVVILNCEFVGNRSDDGGLLNLLSNEVAMENSICRANTGRFTLLSFAGSALVSNSVLLRNRVMGSEGNTSLLGAGTVDLAGCTVSGNVARGPMVQASDVALSNCIVAGNEFWSGHEGDSTLVEGPAAVDCTCIYGNSSGDWVFDLAGLLGVSGNLWESPRFCDSSADDYHLRYSSPCRPEVSGCGLMGALGVGCDGDALFSHWIPGETMDHVVSESPTLGWSRSVSAPQAVFEIEMGLDSDWTSAELWQPGVLTGSDSFVVYSGPPLAEGETYYSRVRIGDGSFWSNWVDTSFRMNSLPAPPTQVAPIGSAEVNVNPPHFSLVVGPDAEGDAQRVQFAVIQDDSIVVDESPLLPALPVVSGDTVTWTGTNPLIENGSYIWLARSYDGFDTTPYWAAWTPFFVNAIEEPPSAPVPALPAQDQIVYSQHPSFAWMRAMDPDPLDSIWYDFAGPDTLAGPSFGVTGLQDTSYTDSSTLDVGRRYYWKVAGRDNQGLTAESVEMSARIYFPGDVDNTWHVSSGDVMALVNFVFRSTPLKAPECVGLVNGDSSITAADIIWLINKVFKGGPVPVPGCLP